MDIGLINDEIARLTLEKRDMERFKEEKGPVLEELRKRTNELTKQIRTLQSEELYLDSLIASSDSSNIINKGSTVNSSIISDIDVQIITQKIKATEIESIELNNQLKNLEEIKSHEGELLASIPESLTSEEYVPSEYEQRVLNELEEDVIQLKESKRVLENEILILKREINSEVL